MRTIRPVDENGNEYIPVHLFPKVEERLSILERELLESGQEYPAHGVPTPFAPEQKILDSLERLRGDLLVIMSPSPERAKYLAQIAHIEIMIKEA